MGSRRNTSYSSRACGLTGVGLPTATARGTAHVLDAVAFCCEKARTVARGLFQEISARVKRGELHGFTTDERGMIDGLWREWRALEAGACMLHPGRASRSGQRR